MIIHLKRSGFFPKMAGFLTKRADFCIRNFSKRAGKIFKTAGKFSGWSSLIRHCSKVYLCQVDWGLESSTSSGRVSSDGYFQYVRGVHSCFRGGDSPPRLSRAWHRLTPRGGRREAKDRPGPLEYDQLKARWAPLS